MKVWKRNAIAATVLVLVCAGVYLNWEISKAQAVKLEDTLDAELVMGEMPSDSQEAASMAEDTPKTLADSFAEIRLSRQESRDSAVALLQETIASEGESTTASAAASSLDGLVSTALEEAQIESLVIAKGYEDCVAYMSDDTINIAVSAPETGLNEQDVALISDIITAQTAYELADIQIIEVK